VADLHKAILVELRRARKGRGVQAANLDQRLGLNLRALAGGQPGTMAAHDVRGALTVELNNCVSRLPRDAQTAVRASLGLAGQTREMILKDRVSWLAEQINRQERTALRRIADAEILLSEEIAKELRRRRASSAMAPDGWYLERLTTLLRLDKSSPESHERRWIVATRDGLQEVMAGLDLPGADGGQRPVLDIEVLYGCQLVRRETPTPNRFQFVLQLPATLGAGETHEFGLILRVPPDQRMRPHYILTPECQCNHFELRIRFDPNRLPRWVRRVDGETVRMFDAADRAIEPLEPDAAGDVCLRFENPALYLGYGAQWKF
jgi:hypothetical protein